MDSKKRPLSLKKARLIDVLLVINTEDSIPPPAAAVA